MPDAADRCGAGPVRRSRRRFQRYGEVVARDGSGRFTLVDDYGHHPVEMAAVIAAARGAFPGQRLVLAFQPHRYTRHARLFEDFVKVLGSADVVLLTEVYAAGEAPIVAADGRTLARALRVAGRVDPVFVDEVDTLPAAVLEHARGGDVVIVMGAGSIGHVAARIVETRGRRRAMTDARSFGKVAVLMGGSSARAEISPDERPRRAGALQARASMRHAFAPSSATSSS